MTIKKIPLLLDAHKAEPMASPMAMELLTEKTMMASASMQQRLPIQSSSTMKLMIEHLEEANGEALVASTMVVHFGSAFPSWMTL